jgi:PhnB protein
MQGFNVALHSRGAAEARRIFDGLSEGGKVTTPLAPVDWAALFGMVTDRFGVPWLVLALGE